MTTLHDTTTDHSHPLLAMSYLPPSPGGAPEDEELKIWLQGHITRLDYLTNPQPPLRSLRTALTIASKEIINVLDPSLDAAIHCAIAPETSIEVEEAHFYASRIVDFESLFENSAHVINKMDAEIVIGFLEAARDEIGWMRNETRRLELHIDNAREMRRMQLRKSFSYAPTPRKHGEVASAPSPIAEAAAEEAEDEEMLDDFVDARERNSVTPPATCIMDVEEGEVVEDDRVAAHADRSRRSATPEPPRLGDHDGHSGERGKSEEERRDSGGGSGGVLKAE